MTVLAVLLVCRFLFSCTLLCFSSQRKHHQAQAQLLMRAVSYMMRVLQLVSSWPWTSQVLALTFGVHVFLLQDAGQHPSFLLGVHAFSK